MKGSVQFRVLDTTSTLCCQSSFLKALPMSSKYIVNALQQKAPAAHLQLDMLGVLLIAARESTHNGRPLGVPVRGC